MKALGIDFVNLIPDYETDLYLNPNLLGGKQLAGISYQHQRSLHTPITLRLLTKRFGWAGQYWGEYRNNKIENRSSHNVTGFYIKDFWMVDMRGKLLRFLAGNVWNLYNDESYVCKRTKYSEAHFDTTRTAKYLISANAVCKINRYVDIIHKVCGGIYYSYRNMRYYDLGEKYEKYLILYTGNIGIYYRNSISTNRFSSFYFVFGGPTSNADIDALPYSIFEHLSAVELQSSFFARTLIGQIGFARGIPIDDQNLFVFGIRDILLWQRTFQADTDIRLEGRRNSLSIPMAVEYSVNKVTFRIGTGIIYSYIGDKKWDSFSTLTRYNSHTLVFKYTFGIQWKLNDYLLFDFYNERNLSDMYRWAVYLKYVPYE